MNMLIWYIYIHEKLSRKMTIKIIQQHDTYQF